MRNVPRMAHICCKLGTARGFTNKPSMLCWGSATCTNMRHWCIEQTLKSDRTYCNILQRLGPAGRMSKLEKHARDHRCLLSGKSSGTSQFLECTGLCVFSN